MSPTGNTRSAQPVHMKEKKVRKTAMKVAALAIASVVALAACGSDGGSDNPGATNEPGGGGKNFTIGFVYPTLNNPYFVTQSEGADAAAAQFGGKVIHTSGDNNVSNQVQQIEDFVSQGVDAIIVQAVDTQGVVAAVNEAIDSGIPVFTTGERIQGAKITTAVFFDNIESGALGGKWISDTYEGGNVLELQGILGTETATQKSEGFLQGLAAGTNGSAFKVVSSQPANYDRAEALTVTENVLQAQDIHVIYASNDEMALGAAQAVEEAGKTGEIVIVGNDGTDDAITAIKSGKLAATIATPAYIQGFIAVHAALHYLGGGTVPETVSERSTIIDATNVEEAASLLTAVDAANRYWEVDFK